jgi:hypothetical protein
MDIAIAKTKRGNYRMMQYIGATVRAYIPAPPDMLWPIISDFTRHPELAGSGEVMHIEPLTTGPIQKGSRFESQQNLRGFRYTTVSHIVACEPPNRLAWRIGLPGTPAFGQVWQFVCIPQGAGTQVEHGVALVYVVPHIWPFTLFTRPVTQGEAQAIKPTLVNLAKLASVEPPTDFTIRLSPPESAAALLPPPMLQGSLWLAGTAVLGAMVVRRKVPWHEGQA